MSRHSQISVTDGGWLPSAVLARRMMTSWSDICGGTIAPAAAGPDETAVKGRASAVEGREGRASAVEGVSACRARAVEGREGPAVEGREGPAVGGREGAAVESREGPAVEGRENRAVEGREDAAVEGTAVESAEVGRPRSPRAVEGRENLAAPGHLLASVWQTPAEPGRESEGGGPGGARGKICNASASHLSQSASRAQGSRARMQTERADGVSLCRRRRRATRTVRDRAKHLQPHLQTPTDSKKCAREGPQDGATSDRARQGNHWPTHGLVIRCLNDLELQIRCCVALPGLARFGFAFSTPALPCHAMP